MTYPPPGGMPPPPPGQPGGGPQPPYPPPSPPLPPMPVGPGYGSTSYDTPRARTSRLAIAAFVTGLFGFLGLVLGIVALRRIRRSGAKGRGFAVAGIVLSCLWLVGGTSLYALSYAGSGISSDVGSGLGSSVAGAGKSPSAPATKPKEVDARKMKVGDCINDSQGASSSATTAAPVEVQSVKVVSCTAPHDGEVLAVFQLSGAVPPSDQQMAQLSAAGCKQRMAARINRDPAAKALATSYYYPTVDSWRTGDREVTCVAVAARQGKKLTRRLQS